MVTSVSFIGKLIGKFFSERIGSCAGASCRFSCKPPPHSAYFNIVGRPNNSDTDYTSILAVELIIVTKSILQYWLQNYCRGTVILFMLGGEGDVKLRHIGRREERSPFAAIENYLQPKLTKSWDIEVNYRPGRFLRLWPILCYYVIIARLAWVLLGEQHTREHAILPLKKKRRRTVPPPTPQDTPAYVRTTTYTIVSPVQALYTPYPEM